MCFVTTTKTSATVSCGTSSSITWIRSTGLSAGSSNRLRQTRRRNRNRPMKFTLSWLKDYLDTDASAEEIAEALTNLGLELEELSNPAEKLKPFVVAGVAEARRHPNADRLRVCMVDTG